MYGAKYVEIYHTEIFRLEKAYLYFYHVAIISLLFSICLLGASLFSLFRFFLSCCILACLVTTDLKQIMYARYCVMKEQQQQSPSANSYTRRVRTINKASSGSSGTYNTYENWCIVFAF